MPNLKSVVSFLDTLLDTKNIKDYPGSYNGLQVENSGYISNIGCAVDADLQTIEMAVKEKIDFLIVHHGLYWNPKREMTGIEYRKMKLLMDNNIALYSSHLPLDIHDEVGNNMLLAKEIRFNSDDVIANYKDFVLLNSINGIDIDEIDQVCATIAGVNPKIIYNKSNTQLYKKIAICSGNGGSSLQKVIESGADIYITGELQQHNHVVAYENNITLFCAGHYGTEKLGVQALNKMIKCHEAESVHHWSGYDANFLDTKCQL